MEEKPIYGTARIAADAGKSESTIRRWRKTEYGAFLEVGSMSNVGGGYGKALWTYPGSLQHLKRTMASLTSKKRSRAAKIRWSATDVSSGNNIKNSLDTFGQV